MKRLKPLRLPKPQEPTKSVSGVPSPSVFDRRGRGPKPDLPDSIWKVRVFPPSLNGEEDFNKVKDLAKIHSHLNKNILHGGRRPRGSRSKTTNVRAKRSSAPPAEHKAQVPGNVPARVSLKETTARPRQAKPVGKLSRLGQSGSILDGACDLTYGFRTVISDGDTRHPVWSLKPVKAIKDLFALSVKDRMRSKAFAELYIRSVLAVSSRALSKYGAFSVFGLKPIGKGWLRWTRPPDIGTTREVLAIAIEDPRALVSCLGMSYAEAARRMPDQLFFLRLHSWRCLKEPNFYETKSASSRIAAWRKFMMQSFKE